MTNFWVLNLEPLTVQTLLIILVVVTLLGGVLALAYIFTHRKDGYDPSMLFTLLIMPLVVSIIVILVSNNLARAFSLAGVFTLVRFRLAMRDASDLAYILASVGIGLALALGYVLLGLIITGFLSVILTVFSTLVLTRHVALSKLIFDVLESAYHPEMIEDVLKSHTKSHRLDRIKTQEKSASYKISYRIRFQHDADSISLMAALKALQGISEVMVQKDIRK